jgi:hypothetical protein
MLVIMNWACGTHGDVRNILRNVVRKTTVEVLVLEGTVSRRIETEWKVRY